MNLPGMGKILGRLDELDVFQDRLEEYLERIAIGVEALVEKAGSPQYFVTIDVPDDFSEEKMKKLAEELQKVGKAKTNGND